MQRNVLQRCSVLVVSHHEDLRHKLLCKSEGFFRLLLPEWSIFPAAGTMESREKISKKM